MKRIALTILLALTALTATTAVWTTPAQADSSPSSVATDESP